MYNGFDFSLTGYHGTKPDLIFKLEQGEEPWTSAKISGQHCSGELGGVKVTWLFLEELKRNCTET